MEAQSNPVDAMIIAAGISMVYNADDWDFAATPLPIASRRNDVDAIPPALN